MNWGKSDDKVGCAPSQRVETDAPISVGEFRYSLLEALRGVLAKKDQLIDRLQTEITRWIDNSYGA